MLFKRLTQILKYHLNYFYIYFPVSVSYCCVPKHSNLNHFFSASSVGQYFYLGCPGLLWSWLPPVCVVSPEPAKLLRFSELVGCWLECFSSSLPQSPLILLSLPPLFLSGKLPRLSDPYLYLSSSRKLPESPTVCVRGSWPETLPHSPFLSFIRAFCFFMTQIIITCSLSRIYHCAFVFV